MTINSQIRFLTKETLWLFSQIFVPKFWIFVLLATPLAQLPFIITLNNILSAFLRTRLLSNIFFCLKHIIYCCAPLFNFKGLSSQYSIRVSNSKYSLRIFHKLYMCEVITIVKSKQVKYILVVILAAKVNVSYLQTKRPVFRSLKLSR